MHPPKVVLVSTNGYVASRDDALLQELLASKIELFCVVGRDAEVWEDALDWMCVGTAGEGKHFITTTAHAGESVEEVIAFAEQFSSDKEGDVEVLYV
jgi:hypothetical protein